MVKEHEKCSGTAWGLRSACFDDAENAEERVALLQGRDRNSMALALPASARHPPMRFDIKDLRLRTAAQTKLKDSTFVDNQNTAGLMVMRSIASSTLQATAVLGSYFFIESGGRTMTPHCADYAPHRRASNLTAALEPFRYIDTERIPERACYVTSYCFWTFPVICAFGVVVIFWKSLLDKRLFYECLLNRILLMQSRTSFLRSPIFWFLFIYGASGLACMTFFDWQGHAERASSSDVDTEVHFGFGLLAYISATCAFIFIICSQWSASCGILPLPSFLQKDCAAAITLLNECVFIPELDFRSAFEGVEQLLEREAEKSKGLLKRRNFYYSFELRTSEMIQLIRDMYDQKPEFDPCPFEDCWKWFCYQFRFFQSYWVTRLLYSPHLVDARSTWFKWWARLHYAYTVFAAMLFIYTFFYLTNEFLVFQDAIEPVLRPRPPEDDIHKIIDHTVRISATKIREAANHTHRML